MFARSQLYEPVINALDKFVTSVLQIYLIATPEVIANRIRNRRQAMLHTYNEEDLIKYSLTRLELISALPYPKIDTSGLTPQQVADEVERCISEHGNESS